MFRFTIRELVLLTIIVAMGVGWWLDHRNRISERSTLQHLAMSLWAVLGDEGWSIEWDREVDRVRARSHDGRTSFTLTPDSFSTIPTTLKNEADTGRMTGSTIQLPSLRP